MMLPWIASTSTLGLNLRGASRRWREGAAAPRDAEIRPLDGFARDLRLALPDVLLPEQELSIQVGHVYSVQIDHRELLAAH